MSKNKGFSLIEVLTAVLLLAGFIALMTQITYGTRNRIKKTAQLEKISLLLESKMLELRGSYQGRDIINLPEEGEREFEEYPGHSWFYETQAINLPDSDLVLSLIGLDDNSLNKQMIDTFQSVLSNTIVELKLTVSYQIPKTRNKSIQLSLSSYFVNYEQAPDFVLNQMSQMLSSGGGGNFE